MRQSLTLAACMTIQLCTLGIHAQPALQADLLGKSTTAQTEPAAFVYVTSNNGQTNAIQGFTAAADGKLTKLPGAPIKANVQSMAVNGKYLFGASYGKNIVSFQIESDGALKMMGRTDAARTAGCSGGSPVSLFLDHSGASLYDFYSNGNACGDNTYQSYQVQKQTGDLSYLGDNFSSRWQVGTLSFIGNNKFAYSAVCDVFTSPPGPNAEIYGFERDQNGLLTHINISAPIPEAASGYKYCPSLAAADPSNHVAISLQPTQNESLYTPQLATYSADKYGNLTTSSTRENMPKSSVLSIFDLEMSPSGKLLAVGGAEGLQIFHFNGSAPISHYTSLITKSDIEQMFWDNKDHLYAISTFTNKLYVFTVTPTSVTEAPGSPYTISSPMSVIVQPKTPRE
jgi:hypothetical protein